MTETSTEDEQRNKGRKVLLSAIYVFFLGIVVLSIFIRLGAGEVLQTDEATHGVNAYEMLRHGNALVNTYKYAVDYFNSKPPLSLWCIMLSYRIFGTGSFGLRFASAISGCLLLSYMWQNLKRKSVILGIWALARFHFDVTRFLYTMNGIWRSK